MSGHLDKGCGGVSYWRSHQVNCAGKEAVPPCVYFLCVRDTESSSLLAVESWREIMFTADGTADVLHDIHPPRYHFLIPTDNDDDWIINRQTLATLALANGC